MSAPAVDTPPRRVQRPREPLPGQAVPVRQRGQTRTNAPPITVSGLYDENDKDKGDWSMELDPHSGLPVSRTFSNPDKPEEKFKVTFGADGSAAYSVDGKPVDKFTPEQIAAIKKAQTLTESQPGFHDKVTKALAHGKDFKDLGTKDKPYTDVNNFGELGHAAEQASELYKKFQAAYHPPIKDPKAISTEDLKKLKALDVYTTNQYARLESKIKSKEPLSPEEQKFHDRMTKEWKEPDGKGGLQFKTFGEPSVASTLHEIAKNPKLEVKAAYVPYHSGAAPDPAEPAAAVPKKVVNGPPAPAAAVTAPKV